MGKLFIAPFLFCCLTCVNAATPFFISPMPSTNVTELSFEERPHYNKTEIPAELQFGGGVIDIYDIPDPT